MTEDADLSGSPERALWLAVIRQAILDAQGVSEHNLSLAVEQELTADARAFLLDHEGYWRRGREEACDKAGIDPDWLRETAEAGPIITATIGGVI